MFLTHWIRSISGKWFSFKTPACLGVELSFLSLLKTTSAVEEIAQYVASEVLCLSPEVISEEFSGKQVFKIFELCFPKINTNETSQRLETVQFNLEKQGESFDSSTSKMLAFLAFHGRIQPSEVLRLPRATVEEILREISELLEADKKFQFDLSTVHALSMVFGDGGKSDASGSSSVRKDSIDLSNIGEDDISKLSQFKDFVKVKR